MARQKIRIRLKAFDHRILDQSAVQIVEAALRVPQGSATHSGQAPRIGDGRGRGGHGATTDSESRSSA